MNALPRKNSSIASIDLETEHINQMKAMGEISDLDEINALIKLEEKKYQIEAKAAKAKAALIVNDVVALKAANAKIIADAEKHELDLTSYATNACYSKSKPLLTWLQLLNRLCKRHLLA